MVDTKRLGKRFTIEAEGQNLRANRKSGKSVVRLSPTTHQEADTPKAHNNNKAADHINNNNYNKQDGRTSGVYLGPEQDRF